MTKFTTAIATAATALLLTGNAFAQMPAAGEGPLFQQETTVSRAAHTGARAAVSVQQVAAGEMNGLAEITNDPNQPTRAEVRQQTRDAIATGVRISVGERS